MVNDYRNEVVAEGLKVLGFVNRFSHGVLRVNRELSTNGNGSPEYNFDLRTALLVIVHNAHCEIKEVDNQGSDDLSRKNCEINTEYICEISGDVKIVYDLIKENVNFSQPEISKRVSFSARKVSTIIKVLKDSGYIKRVGSNKTGHWEVLKQ
jgi:ATP-dependent DNA helicase RecG